MLSAGPARLLSIYLNEGDKWHHEPLYRALLARAHGAGLAGATVLRGESGVGGHGHVHDHITDSLMANLPIVVQFVDSAEAIDAFLPAVKEMVPEGLVTVQNLEAVSVKRAPAAPRQAVEAVMRRDTPAVSADTPVKELATRLSDPQINYLYVTDQSGRLLGVVGRRDLLQRVLEPHPSMISLLADSFPGLGTGQLHKRIEQAHAFTAEQVMASPAHAVTPGAPVVQAIRLMLERGYLEVPVVENGRLVGVVSQHDVLRLQMAEEEKGTP